jgi:hypothetical protein
LTRLEDIGRSNRRARRGPVAARSQLVVSIESMTDDELQEVLDEGLRDWASRAGKAVSRAARKVVSRAAKEVAKRAKRLQQSMDKKRPKPKKEKPTIKPRAVAPVRPKGKPGGIPPAPPKSIPEPVKPPPSPTVSTTKPRKPEYTWAELQKLRKKGSKDTGEWPANWDTTAPGPPVSMPKDKTPETVKRRQGPKGRKGVYKPSVSHADLYKHMTRAIYVGGKQRGYAFREGASKSSQKIARAMLIKWGYAKRATKKGGIPDRRRIEMTPKGQKRSFMRHAHEPTGVKRAKDLDYQAIVARSPL